jgi:phospholipid/cholesterol/gamma-HCH transport system substrate-binding protein
MIRRLVPTILSLMFLTSGCGGFSGLADAPLPGGPDLGEDPITVTVEVADALNLAPQASVKVDDVTVGTVRTVRRDGWQAEVIVEVPGDVELPANAVAAIRQTGLLGEKYVELAEPDHERASGSLTDGAVIGIRRSGRSLEVEEVLGAMSLLLNGGGIDRLRTITVELRDALQGREPEFRVLLTQLDTFTGTLSANRGHLHHAIAGLDRLAATARRNQQVIEATLEQIGPGLRVLAEQRRQLTAMLRATARLSAAATTTITAAHTDLVASLDALAPVLRNLAAAGDNLPKALRYALTFPFPSNAFQALKGDYVNVAVEAELGEADLLALLGLTPNTGPGTPNLPGLPQLPGLPGLPQLPGLPPLPGLSPLSRLPALSGSGGLLSWLTGLNERQRMEGTR